MEQDLFESIRENEKISHERVYTQSLLYQHGSWLSKPVKTVMDLLPYFDEYERISVLDLGSGVGRNAIAIAKYYTHNTCTIDCVDFLDIAIQKLTDYASEFGVSNQVNPVLSDIESYSIEKEKYDLILSVSALEHVASKEILLEKLLQIKQGIHTDGIVCLIMNSEVEEFDNDTGEKRDPQFEVNMQTDELLCCLEGVFSDWKILKNRVVCQCYDIPRGMRVHNLSTKVVTFVARK